MQYFPLFVDTQHTRCLVVGAGEVASRKLELMVKTQANLRVVSPWVSEAAQRALDAKALQAPGSTELRHREFAEIDLDGINLVFVATDVPEVNQWVHDLAVDKNILVNVVDNKPLCKFITPSIIDRSPIIIAMVSGGVAPVLLRNLRERLESLLPQNIRQLGAFCEKFREVVKSKLPTVQQRRYFWEQVLDGDIAEKVTANDTSTADTAFHQLLDEYANDLPSAGEVYLIGAGPGDPDLLTFKALRLMQKADAVVYDRLVSEQILDLVRRDAEKFFVGKEKSNHSLPQDEINQLLIDEARKGNRVVRLKGGDPYIFGRGGEEVQQLLDAGIKFQVIPGITAASGAASYAGIPLTHRDHAQAVTFATAHLRDGKLLLDWKTLIAPNHTLVLYMGLTALPQLVEQLISHGLSSSTPIALIEKATTGTQKVLTSTLEAVMEHPDLPIIQPPTLIIIGNVVTLHETHCWYTI